MEKIWWKQITKANYFLKQVAEALIENKNVVLDLPEIIPWEQCFFARIEERVSARNPDKGFLTISCPTGNIGETLLHDERFCEVEKQNAYRYGMSYGAFLGKQENIPFHSYYIWVDCVTEQKLSEWSSFLEDYQKNLGTNQMAANFVLKTFHNQRKKVKGTQYISFAETIDDYDKFAFCTLASSGCDMKAMLRPYLAELVSRICDNDMELSALCVKTGVRFLKNPEKVVEDIVANKYRSDGTLYKRTLSPKDYKSILWKSQIKQVFASIEEYRCSFIARNHREIEDALKKDQQTQLGEEPRDVELGKLKYLIDCEYLQVSQQDWDQLNLFRDARNLLAHIEPLDFDTIEKILTIQPVK